MSRKLIIVRGPQGSGKSTLVRRAGLEGFSLSADKIRDVIAGDTLSQSGQFIPNHDHGPLVWGIFNDSVTRRISGGEVVCLDGTFANGGELYETWKKFDAAGYKSLLIDLYGFDDGLRRQRNAQRDERKRVPETSVDRMREIYDSAPIPPIMRNAAGLTFASVTDDAGAERALRLIPKFLRDPRTVRDLSDYREVIHVGDIQGTHSPLVDPASPLRGGLDPDVFHVFLGDLFDRGKENGEVADWFVRNALGKPNVALIGGNHEDYVDMQAEAGSGDIDLPHSEWLRLTWPQIREAGVDWREIRKISRFAQDYLDYTWRGKRVLCSHAGFGRWPSNPDLVSRHQMRRGNGHYGVDVDAEWDAEEAETGRYQIHGHRNERMRPTLTTRLSFNLEGQVEFGGHLRMLRLGANGFEPIDIRPRVFRTMQEDVALNKEVDRMSMSKFPPMLPWADVGAAPGRVSPETSRMFGDHKMIQVKEMGNLPGIVSVNFTRDAFRKAHWDDYTTVARGLFLDAEDGSVVARSYPKSFNHEERPETSAAGLAAGVTFPLTAYEKRNGFLCITGYSERLGRPIIASKSRTDGTFADIAAEVLRDTLGEAALERIARLNRDQVCSLVFEIEEPVRDPHIIRLDEPKAVLLGCIRRSEHFEQASYKDLVKIAKWVGCDVKKVIARIPNDRAMASFNRRVAHDPSWAFEGRKVEGAMIEDDAGFTYKLKTHYYRNWKFMRSAADEIRGAKEAGRAPRLERFAEVGEPFSAFLDWARTLSAPALARGIVDLREAFENDRGEMERIRDETPSAPPPDEAADRFRALVSMIDANPKMTPEGMGRFLAGALADPFKAEILKGYENFEAMMERSDPGDAPGPGM